MDSPLDLSVPSAQPVSLPRPTSEYDPPAGTLLTVTGWVIELAVYYNISYILYIHIKL